MHETDVAETERGSVSVARKLLRVCAPALACVLWLGAPQQAWTMAADGALLTNAVSATYHGPAGFPDLACPTCPQYPVTYSASSNVLISCPVVVLQKSVTPTVEGAGGTVTYRLWAINDSINASAFNFVMTDRLQNWLSFAGPTPAMVVVSPVWTDWFGNSWAAASSADGTTYTAGAPAIGQAGLYYLRWSLGVLGPGKSGFIEFMAKVL